MAGQSSRTSLACTPVLAFVGRRVVAGLITILIASAFIFFAINGLPGDVASAVLGQDATPDRVAQLRSQLELDQSLFERYFSWLGGVVTGDFGVSTAALVQGAEQPVWDMLKGPLGNSLILAGIAFAVFVPASIALGAWSAVRAHRAVDHAISSSALTLGAMPEFLLGTALIVVFFTQLGWLPPISQVPPGASPLSTPLVLVLPALTLVLHCLSHAVRLVRAAMIEVLESDFVATARLNGYSERTIVWRMALPNAIAPSIQVLGNIARYMIGGILIVEHVFAYPGIGAELVSAVSSRDLQVVSIAALILAAGYVVVNIITDLLVVLIVPRLRTELR